MTTERLNAALRLYRDFRADVAMEHDMALFKGQAKVELIASCPFAAAAAVAVAEAVLAERRMMAREGKR